MHRELLSSEEKRYRQLLSSQEEKMRKSHEYYERVVAAKEDKIRKNDESLQQSLSMQAELRAGSEQLQQQLAQRERDLQRANSEIRTHKSLKLADRVSEQRALIGSLQNELRNANIQKNEADASATQLMAQHAEALSNQKNQYESRLNAQIQATRDAEARAAQLELKHAEALKNQQMAAEATVEKLKSDHATSLQEHIKAKEDEQAVTAKLALQNEQAVTAKLALQLEQADAAKLALQNEQALTAKLALELEQADAAKLALQDEQAVTAKLTIENEQAKKDLSSEKALVEQLKIDHAVALRDQQLAAEAAAEKAAHEFNCSLEEQRNAGLKAAEELKLERDNALQQVESLRSQSSGPPARQSFPATPRTHQSGASDSTESRSQKRQITDVEPGSPETSSVQTLWQKKTKVAYSLFKSFHPLKECDVDYLYAKLYSLFYNDVHLSRERELRNFRQYKQSDRIKSKLEHWQCLLRIARVGKGRPSLCPEQTLCPDCEDNDFCLQVRIGAGDVLWVRYFRSDIEMKYHDPLEHSLMGSNMAVRTKDPASTLLFPEQTRKSTGGLE
jgi:hypothetical protein